MRNLGIPASNAEVTATTNSGAETRTPRFATFVAGLLLALILTGCNKQNADATTEAWGSFNAKGTSTNLAQAAAAAEAKVAAISNQFSASQQAQADLIQKLVGRIEELEKQRSNSATHSLALTELKQAQAEQKEAHAQREANLLAAIKGLEAKVTAIQAGKILPEITVAAEDGPTPRDLDQKIRIIERNNELASEAAEAEAKQAPRISAGANGFSLSSADTNFVIRFKGLIQADSRFFFSDNPRSQGNDTFLLRRARPILEGTVYRDFDFQFVPDFGGSSVQIFDANLNYRLRPELQLKAGKFKGPVGYENLLPDAGLPFNERSLVTDFVESRNVGAQLWGDALDARVGYAVGVFNAGGDERVAANSDFSDKKEFAGRLSFQPFKGSGKSALEGLGFGVGGSTSEIRSNAAALPATTGGTLPGYFTTAQQQFFAYNPTNGTVVANGTQWRTSPYLTYTRGPFGVLGEYAISHQSVLNSFSRRSAELDHTAYEVTAQWVLTGEPASFSGITPKRPFTLNSPGWGAWQVVGRFSQLDIDRDAFRGFANPYSSAQSATAWSLGLNWWLNKNVRVLTSFSRTEFTGGGGDRLSLTPPATVTRQPENVIFSRLQLAF